MATLGIDTSNYTTSLAVFDGAGGRNVGRLLKVRSGELGLRQSDALFQHVKYLPELCDKLKEQGFLKEIEAVAASTWPRWVEGSYMPCFLAGAGHGRTLAQVLDVPFYPVSHQQGHIAAAAWSAGRMDLLDTPHLAWHLSGGTTELLHVVPGSAGNVQEEILGGTTDLSAGQLIDRTGKLLGLDFPSGKALDALASEAPVCKGYRVKTKELSFSLSGVENQVRDLVEQGGEPGRIARFTLETIIDVIGRVTDGARAAYPGLPVLLSGGVASNRLLRERVEGALFARPEYATDNAMGVAILAHRALERGK